eukprot:CAMPEP_0169141534 /NCGR_PEP_ID=MMETSP1015-20121227/44363_1 /TAXON_ID=342587 /ORGANISM="Karlodinium micrum, Strain CCMP2283" /LENGTH=94 /DNA_ID=CAMNT_0009207931 /DNA_START=290 /DNA_END=574 /DNA_ORIENTATION=-
MAGAILGSPIRSLSLLNENNHVKLGARALATAATLGKLSDYLFGNSRALSPRKMCRLLVLSAGVGLCGEDNTRVMSQVCGHFKCGENDTKTDGD